MARKRNSKRRKDQAPGWVWMLFGLSLGLIVALAVYLRGETELSLPQVTPVVTTPPVPASPQAQNSEQGEEAEQTASRFDFYEMLPKFEVVIPEIEADARADAIPNAVDEPGRYVIQTGSFSVLADADRMRANLALLGIESRTQRVTIDDDVFHRVRIGPTSDLRGLNRTRRRLRDAHIEALLMQIPD